MISEFLVRLAVVLLSIGSILFFRLLMVLEKNVALLGRRVDDLQLRIAQLKEKGENHWHDTSGLC